MKIFIKFFLLIFIFSCSTANDQQDRRLITGQIENMGVGAVTLEHFQDGELKTVDTLTVNEDGTYFSTFSPEEPGYYRLNFYDTQFVNLLLTDEPIVVNVDGSGPMAPYDVSGSPHMEALDELNALMSSFQEEVNQMNETYRTAAQAGDEEKIAAIQEEYQAAATRVNETIKQKIRDMGATVGVLQAVNFLDKDSEFAFIDSVARVLDQELPDYQIKKEFIAEVESLRKLAIGSMAPEIALPNPDGEIVKLSSLRGQYVLIDFWAAWCGPCRRENPNVVRMYDKYHEKGFEILGVSLDREREDWLKAIEKDGLEWIHVSDLQYFNSEAAGTYNIQAIPATYLIDREGRIMDKNLRGKALEDKLAEIFG